MLGNLRSIMRFGKLLAALADLLRVVRKAVDKEERDKLRSMFETVLDVEGVGETIGDLSDLIRALRSVVDHKERAEIEEAVSKVLEEIRRLTVGA